MAKEDLAFKVHSQNEVDLNRLSLGEVGPGVDVGAQSALDVVAHCFALLCCGSLSSLLFLSDPGLRSALLSIGQSFIRVALTI